MSKLKKYVTFEVTQRVDVEVELTLDELCDRLGTDELAYMAEKKGLLKMSGPGKGDPAPDRRIHEAYIAAKAMPDCPQPIRDLLWHIHGLAI